MKTNYAYAVIGEKSVTLTDKKPCSSPLWDTLLENVTVLGNRHITIEGERIKYDLDFATRYDDLEKYTAKPKKNIFGIPYIPSGWAELKKREHSKHSFFHIYSMTEHENGNISFTWSAS